MVDQSIGAVLTGRRFLVQLLVAEQILESVLAAGGMPRQLQSTASVPLSKVVNSKMLRACLEHCYLYLNAYFVNLFPQKFTCVWKKEKKNRMCVKQQHGIVGFKKVYFLFFF